MPLESTHFFIHPQGAWLPGLQSSQLSPPGPGTRDGLARASPPGGAVLTTTAGSDLALASELMLDM